VIIKDVAEKFIDYLLGKVPGLSLKNCCIYRARYYKRRPGVKRYVAVFNFE